MELCAGADLCSTDHSVNGLKFGKKIYFEDVGGGTGGAQVKSGNADGGTGGAHVKSGNAGGGGGSGSSSGLPPQSPAKKGRSGGAQGGQRPRCQVQGCQVDLSNAKSYYSKHKVCGLHSKTSKVIVAGLEQRFCQQCSRFHLLPEFDQGKRSCRKRLAGHNERRRKPPTGTIMSPCYGSLSSSFRENGSNGSTSRGGGVLMDFSAYSNLSGGASWPDNGQPDYGSRNHPSGAGHYLQQAWQNNSSDPPSDLVLHGSSARTTVMFPGIPTGECSTGVSDTSRAPSLLSNQPWGSRARSSTLGVNNLLNPAGTQMVQPFGTHGVPISHFSSPSWGFKSDAVGSSCNEVPSNLGFGPMAHNPQNYHNPGEHEVSQQSNRPQYLDIDHSRGYDSPLQHINWSL